MGEGIQEALNKGYVTRDKLWVTSKIWNTDHRAERVRPAAEVRKTNATKPFFVTSHGEIEYKDVHKVSGSSYWLLTPLFLCHV